MNSLVLGVLNSFPGDRGGLESVVADGAVDVPVPIEVPVPMHPCRNGLQGMYACRLVRYFPVLAVQLEDY